jgi:hypothetical protein
MFQAFQPKVTCMEVFNERIVHNFFSCEFDKYYFIYFIPKYHKFLGCPFSHSWVFVGYILFTIIYAEETVNIEAKGSSKVFDNLCVCTPFVTREMCSQ